MQEQVQALYLHIPFCLRKCSYCDFYSIAPADPDIMQRYSQKLIQLIQKWGKILPDARLDSIYLGGGTPSLLSGRMVNDIMEAIAQSWQVAPNVEISLEANPATMTLEKAQSFRQAGVNRISLGVQSFLPGELKTLGRLHDVKEVLDTVECITQAGFSNYNLDLIYGVPGQTLDSWETSLQQAAACHPDHLSLYLLQMDEKVPLYRQIERGEKIEPEEDSIVKMFDWADEFCQNLGYEHYEISNFALPGKKCRHNLHYWQSHAYLGLGAGAVSFLEGKRFLLSQNMANFFAGDSVGEAGYGEILEEMTSKEERLADAMVMGLRCMRGVSRKELQERFGVDICSYYAQEIASCRQAGLLEYQEGFLRLTRKGWFLSNQVLWHFV